MRDAMMHAETAILLIRHGHTDAIGQRLVGRLPGVHLTDAGRAQAARLCDRLHEYEISAVYSSPLERAVETAAPLARSRNLPVLVDDAFNEIDFGAWTGLTFDVLSAMPQWQRFNHIRGSADVPNGESSSAAQSRIVSALDRLHDRHPAQTVAVVSHLDLIRAAVLHVAGIPLDLYARFDIDPVSVTEVRLNGQRRVLTYVNDASG